VTQLLLLRGSPRAGRSPGAIAVQPVDLSGEIPRRAEDTVHIREDVRAPVPARLLVHDLCIAEQGVDWRQQFLAKVGKLNAPGARAVGVNDAHG